MNDNSALLHVPERDVAFNARIKQYPTGDWEIMACNRNIFRVQGWEVEYNGKYQKHKAAKPAEGEGSEAEKAEAAAAAASAEDSGCDAAVAAEPPKAANTERAARRAAAKLRDLALCNDFKWFVTLTLDAAKIDRYDVKKITRHLNRWLDNRVRRDGLKYVLVPERHKDGALHFHGFINDQPGLVPSGTWKVPGHKRPVKPRSGAELRRWEAAGAAEGFHEVFNWDSWGYGFSTAIQLYGEYSAAVAYVCKYIRKQQEGGKIGGRWYYSGGALEGPEIVRCDWELTELLSSDGAYSFEVPEAGLVFGILRGRDQ